MVRKQHLSTAAGLNDLGTTGKEVEENYKRVPEASRSKLCTGLRGMYDHGADPL